MLFICDYARLILIGKPGWLVDELIARITRHREAGRRLLHLGQVSDELLLALYRQATGVVLAAANEGYGLPIIEAARHGVPLLLRDIPVFREIAGANATYFQGRDPATFGAEIQAWIEAVAARSIPDPAGLVWQTWDESARALLAAVFDGRRPAGNTV